MAKNLGILSFSWYIEDRITLSELRVEWIILWDGNLNASRMHDVTSPLAQFLIATLNPLTTGNYNSIDNRVF